MKQRNTDIDWIRAILIILMILIHIVSFGNAYPQLKAGILSFMMPTFLIITGYLVNIEKSPKEMGRYLMCLALPYVIMVTGFSVLSYFMPVRDGITELSLSQICEKIFVTSIGPYWFIQTMIICGILYYVSFKGATWGTLRQGKTTMSTTTSLFIFSPPYSCSCPRHPLFRPVPPPIISSERYSDNAISALTEFSVLHRLPCCSGSTCWAWKNGMTGARSPSSSPAGAAFHP